MAAGSANGDGGAYPQRPGSARLAMFCSRCGHENADDTKFCGECGAPQQEDGQEPGPYRPVEDAAESEGPDGAPEPSDIPPRDLGQLSRLPVS